MSDDKTGLSKEGRLAIYHLIVLTMRYSETYAEQIFVLWMRLIDPPNQSNGHAMIRSYWSMLAARVFIDCAAKIVACLSQSAISRQISAVSSSQHGPRDATER